MSGVKRIVRRLLDAVLWRLRPLLYPLRVVHPRRWPFASLRSYARAGLAADLPVGLVTSFNEKLYEVSGRRCVKSFRTLHPHYELHAYIEADDAVALTAMTLELESMGVVVHKLDDEPLLARFETELRDVVPEEYGGSASEELFATRVGDEGAYFRRNMIRWLRKVVALEAASRDRSDGLLIWIDCDTYATRELTRPFVARLFAGADIFYLKANRGMSELGVLGLDLRRPNTRRVIEGMVEYFLQREFLDRTHWSECIAFDVVRKRLGAAARDIAIWADGGGHVVPHSPLRLYVVHDKGQHRRRGFYLRNA